MKMPWSYARVLKASRELEPTLKLVWLEHVGLIHGKSGIAITSASTIAGRDGLSRKTVERARLELGALDLLAKHVRGSGRTDGWEPRLPPGCRPHALRLTDDEVLGLAERLDAHIKRVRQTAPIPGSRDDAAATSDTPCPSIEHDDAASVETADGPNVRASRTQLRPRSEHEVGVTDGGDGGDGSRCRSSIPGEGDEDLHHEQVRTTNTTAPSIDNGTPWFPVAPEDPTAAERAAQREGA